jgi:predicted small secreted protein
MRVRGAIAILVLVAAFVAGCGGGSTGAAKDEAAGPEEAGFVVGGPGSTPAGGTPLRGARLRIAEARHVQEGEMVAGEEGWVRSEDGVFWARTAAGPGGRSPRPCRR